MREKIKKETKIKISNTIWTIKYLKSDDPLLDGHQGMCCYMKDEIWICDSLSEQQTRLALRHELTHVLLAESGFNQDCKNVMGSFYEHFVDALSKCLDDLMENYK